MGPLLGDSLVRTKEEPIFLLFLINDLVIRFTAERIQERDAPGFFLKFRSNYIHCKLVKNLLFFKIDIKISYLRSHSVYILFLFL